MMIMAPLNHAKTAEAETAELEISVLPNNIHIYRLTAWSDAGLKAWEDSLLGRLDQSEGEMVLSIYDMRHLDTISRAGFETVNRLDFHPKSHTAFSAAVIKSRRLAILVDTLIKMRRNSGRNRIFSDMEDAIQWLLLKQKIEPRI